MLKGLDSRLNHLKYSSINASHCRTFCSRTVDEFGESFSDVEVEEDIQSNTSQSFYIEHPDVARRSKVRNEAFYLLILSNIDNLKIFVF